jgi:hypothetical protein
LGHAGGDASRRLGFANESGDYSAVPAVAGCIA